MPCSKYFPAGKAGSKGGVCGVERRQNMKTIDEILNHLTATAAAPMIVRPATGEDIRLCNKDLLKMKFPLLPEGYAAFLGMLNGFAWNGVEFFSTDQVTDTESAFTLPDIVTANEDFTECNQGLEHCLCLGRADEDLYVYNTTSGRYEALDMTGRDVMEDFETFEAMFVGVTAPRI